MVKNRVRTTCPIIVIVLVAVGIPLIGILGTGLFLAHQAKHYRTRLLCNTDHVALRNACRELSRQVRDGELKVGSYSVRRFPDQVTLHFPGAIRVLRPRNVVVERDGCVRIDMAEAFDDFGIRYVYPEERGEPSDDFKGGDLELTKALWYYDDFYRHRGRDIWEGKVEAMLRSNPSRLSPGSSRED